MEPFELQMELPTIDSRPNTPHRMGLLPTSSFAVPPLGLGPLPTNPFAVPPLGMGPLSANPFHAAGTVNPPLPAQGDEDSDEWEYEYSTTDTETYYVTLDLSHPDLKPKEQRSLNQEEDEDELQYEIPAPATPEVDVQKNAEGPSKVQILDLHTENPLVSYRGHLFSCEWRTNVGTELLFTPHDTQYEEENLTPILRCLPGDVDLIAASSCRIVGKPIILKPKAEASNSSNLSRKEKAGPKSIPIGNQASQKRKDQGRFLEELQRIKREKGEEDEVTITITRRRNRDMWKAELMRQRQEEREALWEIIGDEEGDEEEREMVRKRLRVMDREDEERKRRLEENGIVGDGKIDEKKLLRMGKKYLDMQMGRTEVKKKRAPRKVVKEGLEGPITSRDTPASENAESLTSFTPSRLMNSVDEGGFDEDIEDERLYDEEEYIYDEDTPNEEDHTQMYDA